MSKPSKNMPIPMSHMIRRWNEEIGSRSSRAPALIVTGDSLFPSEGRHAANCQSFNGQTAILIERVLLSGLEEFLATPRRPRVQIKDALHKGVRFPGEALSGNDLGDQSDLQRAL